MKKFKSTHYLVTIAFIVIAIIMFRVEWNPFRQQNINQISLKKAYSLNLVSKSTIKSLVKKNKKEVMMGHPDIFAEMHREIRTRGNEKFPTYPLNYRETEIQKAIKNLKTKNSLKSNLLKSMEVVERGPANVGGRTRAIAVDPTDPSNNTWFAGAVGGGIWKTSDAGKNWEYKSNQMPNLAISSLVIAPSNPDVIWAGTGEGFYNIDAVRGDGLIASFDHGENWQQVTGTTQFGCVNRLIVDPGNEKNLSVAVSTNIYETPFNSSNGELFGRIYKTTDAGNTWKIVYDDNQGKRVQDLIYHPADFAIQYAAINSLGIVKSTDSGETWNTILDISGVGRIELAIAPTNPDILYAAVESYNESGVQVSLLYKSINAGENWTDLTNGGSLGNWLGAQGWYDNTLAVNPYNEEDVYLGGIQLWRLTHVMGGIGSIEENNTQSFLDFMPWGGYNNSGIGTGAQFSNMTGLPQPINLNSNDYVSIEWRFGPGIKQMAHRFPYDGSDLSYEDYVEVPFQVWDVDHNKQLMVSFLDIDLNGLFNLVEMNNELCEFVFVNSVEYNATSANQNIMGNDGLGFLYKNIYTIGPVKASGTVWDPNNLPQSNIAINYNNSGEPVPALAQISSGYNPLNQTGTHVDHHNLTLVKLNETDSTFRIINGNDGGVFYSDDEGVTWKNTLHGYNTTQFYGVDKKHGADEYIGGMQDNGTWQSPHGEEANAASTWIYQIGGDGYETTWNYNDPNLIMGGYQFNGIYKSTDEGLSWNSLVSMIENGAGNAPFVTKLAKSNSDPDLVFAVGVSGVWRTDNFGENWNLIPIAKEKWNMTALTQIEISYANPQVVWAGAHMNNPNSPQASLHVSTNGGLDFIPTSSYTAMDMGRISGLATHPIDEQTAYAMFSFSGAPKIVRTTDLGATWHDITGFENSTKSSNGFPDVATYCALVMPQNRDIIWAGTEIGLFESIDNGLTWHYAIDEFPAVSIWQMNITDNQVVIATHGRGIITVTIPELPEPPVVTLAPKLESFGLSIFESTFNLKVFLRSPYDSTQLTVDNQYYSTLPKNSVATDTIIGFKIDALQTLTFQLKSFKGGKTYLSGKLIETVYPLLDATHEYLNNFENDNDEFVGAGFRVGLENGFTNKAIHTNHPYADNQNLNYMLRAPIVVNDENSIMTFNEIAILEPGEPGSSYPSTYFYDYVIVEGSKNAKQWQYLEKGWDAQAYPEWLQAYNQNSLVDESLFRKRTIDLQSKFKAGDTILIRFRLYSDAAVNSWGWAIDSLEIQKELIGIKDNYTSNKNISLSQNYPNPFSDFTYISYKIPERLLVQIEVYNIEGKFVRTLVNNYQSAGSYSINMNASDLPEGTYFYRIQVGNFVQTKKMVLIR